METSNNTQVKSPRRWRVFAYTVGLVRFSIIILIATFFLLWVDQGQDLIRTIDEDKRHIIFVVGMLLSGFSIWLWARTLLDIRYPSPPYPETLADLKQRLPLITHPKNYAASTFGESTYLER